MCSSSRKFVGLPNKLWQRKIIWLITDYFLSFISHLSFFQVFRPTLCISSYFTEIYIHENVDRYCKYRKRRNIEIFYNENLTSLALAAWPIRSIWVNKSCDIEMPYIYIDHIKYITQKNNFKKFKLTIILY